MCPLQVSGWGSQGQLGLGVLVAALPPLDSPPRFGIQSFPESDLRPGLCQDSWGAPGCGILLGGLRECGVLTHGQGSRALWEELVMSPA